MIPDIVPKESKISKKRKVHTQSQKNGLFAYFHVSLPDGMFFVSTMNEGPPGEPHSDRLVTQLLFWSLEVQ